MIIQFMIGLWKTSNYFSKFWWFYGPPGSDEDPLAWFALRNTALVPPRTIPATKLEVGIVEYPILACPQPLSYSIVCVRKMKKTTAKPSSSVKSDLITIAVKRERPEIGINMKERACNPLLIPAQSFVC